MNSARVMHIVDTLAAGGRETVVVNLVNSLPRERYSPYLCTTRGDGVLEKLVREDVGRLRLKRAFRYDVRGLYRLVNYIRKTGITLLHAHDASLFIAVMAAQFRPFPNVIWHDHFGLYATEERSVWLYGAMAARVGGVIAVNEHLADWSRLKLHVAMDRVWYIPNFVCCPNHDRQLVRLPGRVGSRIVCVANLRAQKDHFTLLRAMREVVREIPTAHLILVGGAVEKEYSRLVEQEIAQQQLGRNVSLLGEREDVPAILHACDIGVLSSSSEGLPLALIEYGMARLPVVATNVGQCREVLDEGRVGVLVRPGSAEELAAALLSLLRSSERRLALGKQLQCRVRERYSPDAVMGKVCEVYEKVLSLA